MLFKRFPQVMTFLFSLLFLILSLSEGALAVAPVANDAAFWALEDVTTTGTLAGSDGDGDATTFSIASQPPAGEGSVTITDSTSGVFVYTPTADFNGATSFTFKANDGITDSAVATISVTINGVDEVVVAVGQLHGFARRPDGTLWGTGAGTMGQMGDGQWTTNEGYSKVNDDTDWAVVVAGVYQVYAIKTDGTLWAWGMDSTYEQLGDGAGLTNVNTPKKISNDTDWAFVNASMRHGMALKSDGSLWVWGDDPYGQLGNGATTGLVDVPTKLGSDTWQFVGTGSNASYGIKTDGTLWSWGINSFNQLGRTSSDTCSSTACSVSPGQVGSATNWVAVDGGYYSGAAINSSGELFTWGTDFNGVLCNGASGNSSTPTKVGTATNWEKVSIFSDHVLALNSLSELYTCGESFYGQLGNGGITDTTELAKVDNDTDWEGIAAGTQHSIVSKTDGNVLASGRNHAWQLGYDTPPGGLNVYSATFQNSFGTASTVYDGGGTINEDNSFVSTLTGTDTDLDAIMFQISTQPISGTATVTNSSSGAFTYTPDENFEGTDSFTFIAKDDYWDSAEATITITVNPANDAPSPTAADILTVQNIAATTDVIHNDPDSGDTHTYEVTVSGVNGTATVDVSGIVTYTPNTNFFGTDSVTVLVKDQSLTGNEVVISVSVDEVVVVPEGFSIPKADVNLAGIGRSDGGDDSSNTDASTGNPKLDIEFDFSMILKDTALNNTPTSIKVYISSRAAPQATDFYSIDLICTGAMEDGATCSVSTLLGPASDYRFYYEAELNDGTMVRYPETSDTYLDGPTVELLTGYSMLSVPRDIDGATLDGDSAFGDTSVYRWVSNGLNIGDTPDGAYAIVTTGNPIKAGEGYFVWKNADGLNNQVPEHGGYPEITTKTHSITLNPGWNIINNPYGGAVKLSDVTVTKDSGWSGTWTEAAAADIIYNAVYYYNGNDWGDTYLFESAPEAELTPWFGYWVYLNKTDNDYRLVVPQPPGKVTPPDAPAGP